MSEPFVGEIKMIGFNFAPRGWAFCDGQLMAISQNMSLFSLLGTAFGGDGRSTFALPDLRGRVAINPGTSPGLLTYRWGQRGGYENVSLSTLNVPAHTHPAKMRAHEGEANEGEPEGKSLAKFDTIYVDQDPDVDMRDDTITVEANTGGNQPHYNIQPFLGIYFVIALVGIFPSRN